MSEDHSTIQQNSDQDARKEENSGPKTEGEDDDEGYKTPTSEEYKIPEVVLSCPPPKPNKRKRLLVNRKNMKKVEVFKGRFVMGSDSDLESFFESFASKSDAAPPPPPPSPPPVLDPDTDESTSPKRRHIDK